MMIRQQLSEALLNSLEFLSDLRREQWRRSIVRGNERAYTTGIFQNLLSVDSARQPTSGRP